MRHLILSLGLILAAPQAGAFEIEARRTFGPEGAARELRVISTADIDVFAPVVAGFLKDNAGVAVDYVVVSSSELMRALEHEQVSFDVAISSAMDLQTKLANDGGALAHRSSVTAGLPEWARWRDNLFAFTQEPAAIVLSRAAFDGLELPRSRQDLIGLLRQHPDRFRDRIGTYDVRQSGLGYLFATQDARTSETYWRLTEVMGFLGARLYCCSSAMIDDVASGRLAVAYNVLASYARARSDADSFQIVIPEDFTTVMLRTALIPKSSTDPELAGLFIDHVLGIAWLNRPLPGYAFPRLQPDAGDTDASLRRISLGPGLLVYLDRFKKRSFLKAWEDAILQN